MYACVCMFHPLAAFHLGPFVSGLFHLCVFRNLFFGCFQGKLQDNLAMSISFRLCLWNFYVHFFRVWTSLRVWVVLAANSTAE